MGWSAEGAEDSGAAPVKKKVVYGKKKPAPKKAEAAPEGDAAAQEAAAAEEARKAEVAAEQQRLAAEAAAAAEAVSTDHVQQCVVPGSCATSAMVLASEIGVPLCCTVMTFIVKCTTTWSFWGDCTIRHRVSFA